MSNLESPASPRALFLGMQGNFSHPPLRALLESDIEVRAIVIPARDQHPAQAAMRRLEPPPKTRSLLPVLHSSLHTSIAHIAWERGIPLWEVQRMSDPETLAVFAAYQPDVLCVACFSLYIPRSILDIPRLGCLNVHPSLLPANRGPDPLFWTFRQGMRQTGATIHLMDEGLDSGPIVAQERVEVPDGIRYAQLEAQCAEAGSKLLARSVWELYQGTAVPRTQDKSQSSYLPLPSSEDFVVPVAQWNAQHVFNFIRGVASRGEPVQLLIDGQNMLVTDAISYSHENTDNDPKAITEGADREVSVQCRDGWVRVKL